MPRVVLLVLKIIIILLIRYGLCNNGIKAKDSRNYEMDFSGAVQSAGGGSIKRSLSVCSNNLTEFYKNHIDKDKINDTYIKEILLNNGSILKTHLIHDFRHNVKNVCKNENALKLELNPDENWTLFENGTLLRQCDDTFLSPKEYCFDIYSYMKNNVSYNIVNPLVCSPCTIFLRLSLYAMILSVPIIVLTIVLYCCANVSSVYDKCVISYLSSLAVLYSLTSLLLQPDWELSSMTIQIIGYVIYFTFTCNMTWTCVISYEVHKTCTNLGEKSSFRRYFLVGCLTSLVNTAIAIIAQTSLSAHFSVIYHGLLILILQYIPYTLVLVYSITTYIRVHRYIKRCEREIRPYAGEKKRAFLNFRLFLFICFMLFLNFLANFLLRLSQLNWKFHFTVKCFKFVFHGVFILLLLICQKKFWKKICQRK